MKTQVSEQATFFFSDVFLSAFKNAVCVFVLFMVFKASKTVV